MKSKKLIFIIITAIIFCLCSFIALALASYTILSAKVTENNPTEILAFCVSHPEANCWDPCGARNFSACYPSPGNKMNEYYMKESVKQSDPDLCLKSVAHDEGDYVTSKETSAEWCLVNYAGEKEDISVCESLENNDYDDTKDYCYYRYAQGAADLEACSHISGYLEYECERRVPLIIDIEAKCDVEADPEVLDQCILDLANETENSDYCMLMSTDLIQNCY